MEKTKNPVIKCMVGNGIVKEYHEKGHMYEMQIHVDVILT